MLVASNALGIGAASFASKSGTSFGNGDEVTEPVEVPRPDFEKRDGNMASKDIAESPTAIAGTPLLAISYQQLAVRVLSSQEAAKHAHSQSDEDSVDREFQDLRQYQSCCACDY